MSRIVFNAAKHAKSGIALIDTRKRKASYRDEEEIETAIKKLMTRIENSGYARDGMKQEIAEFRNSFLKDQDGNLLTFGDQLKK
jgi:hypothetical protein